MSGLTDQEGSATETVRNVHSGETTTPSSTSKSTARGKNDPSVLFRVGEEADQGIDAATIDKVRLL